MIHELPRNSSFWQFLFSIDQDLSPSCSAARLSVWRSVASGGLFTQAARRRQATGTVRSTAELLLRAGRLPQAGDTAFGAVPGTQSILGRGGGAGERHATRPQPATGA